uniref:Uncharacterized protein n=1 Tax=Neolamprologus brichardi TaxID=32507 RepID=A0A3Q4GE78_NEOBR
MENIVGHHTAYSVEKKMSSLYFLGGGGSSERVPGVLMVGTAPKPISVSFLMDLLNVSNQMIIGSDGQLRNFSINTVFCFLQELSAHLISINSERKAIYVMFATFEDIWKFTTYYKIGFLRHCMENLLLDQTFWLSSSKDDFAIEVTIQEETLNLFYRGILLQEGWH